MNYELRRTNVANQMADNSILILFSGIECHVSADEYYSFEANRNFFYLTGLRRERMVLMIEKFSDKPKTTLFIEKVDPTMERWYGRLVTVDEAKAISGIDNVRIIDDFEAVISRIMADFYVEYLYMDCFRYQKNDMADYNALKAQEFGAAYPGCTVKNLHPIVAGLRMQKDADEIEAERQAIAITKEALEHVMKTLTPGMKEYQAQANFEYKIKYLGADCPAFPTIAGSGMNGTMLHYDTNRETCEDGTLLLMDLGARLNGYNADITRTYPVNGKFSERQRVVYDIVLKANRTVAKEAKPGMTLRELNEICTKVLAEGCMEIGLIEKPEDIGKYYMHGVSHHLGIDVHDVTVNTKAKLLPGAVITDEPGLYIDEWAIGIRIEDDLLITEDGCEVLSEDIIRNPDEIEAFMADR